MAMDTKNALTLALIQVVLLLIAIVAIIIVAFIFGLLANVDTVKDGLYYAVLLACSMLIAGAIFLKKK